MASVLVNMPKTAKRGEVIEIKTLIAHPMETGFRPGTNGRLIPRNIIGRFACEYDGVEVFAIDLTPAIAANPFISFTTVATSSGTLTFRWTGDSGFSVEESASLTVE
jgi:sulfur-oxidizing protein SoxZ